MDFAGFGTHSQFPLAERYNRPYLAFNGDVDASKHRRWNDH
jgi:hypothetical protein